MLNLLINFQQDRVSQVNDGGIILETDNMVLLNILVESSVQLVCVVSLKFSLLVFSFCLYSHRNELIWLFCDASHSVFVVGLSRLGIQGTGFNRLSSCESWLCSYQPANTG